MVTYTKPQQRKKEGSERLTGERGLEYIRCFIADGSSAWQIISAQVSLNMPKCCIGLLLKKSAFSHCVDQFHVSTRDKMHSLPFSCFVFPARPNVSFIQLD